MSGQERHVPPDPGTDRPVYPASPTVLVNPLCPPSQEVLMEDGDVVTVVDNNNGTWSVENVERMEDTSSNAKRNREDDEDFEQTVVKKTNKKSVETPNSREGVNDSRSNFSPGINAEHLLNRSEGKVFKDVIIASATSQRIFSNPKVTRALLDSGGFSTFAENGFEVKGKGSSVRIRIDASSTMDLSAIKKLDNHEVHVWCPLTSEHSIGVISPIDASMDLLADFLPNIRLLGNDSASSTIIDCKRLKKRGKELELVKLIFKGPLPEKLVWNYQVFYIRPYIYDPVRCFRCQFYGHGSSSCNGKITCPFCCANHHLKECPSKRDGKSPLCFSCNESHMAGSRACEFFKQAAIIEKQRHAGEISYEESRKQYNALNQGKKANVGKGKQPNNLSVPNNFYTSKVKETGRNINVASGIDSHVKCSNQFDLLSDGEQDPSGDDFYLSIDDMGFDKSFTSTPRRRKKFTRHPEKTYSKIVEEKLPNKDRRSVLPEKGNPVGATPGELQSSYQPSPVLCSEYYKLIDPNNNNVTGARSKNLEKQLVNNLEKDSPRSNVLPQKSKNDTQSSKNDTQSSKNDTQSSFLLSVLSQIKKLLTIMTELYDKVVLYMTLNGQF